MQLQPVTVLQSVHLQGGLVVAEVISVKAHPKADRLRVCSVDYGHDVAQVVTNAANVAEGMKVIFAVCTHGVVNKVLHECLHLNVCICRVVIQHLLIHS